MDSAARAGPTSATIAGVNDTLQQLADQQGGAFTRAQALAAGHLRREIQQNLTDGTWRVVQRGIYICHDLLTAYAATPGGAYLAECAARRLLLPDDSLISHESAAIVHSLALLDPVTGPVRVTVPRPGSSTRGHLPGRFVAEVPAQHRTSALGIPVTTPARTVVDLARTLTLESALVTADDALRQGLDRLALLDVVAACRRWPGVDQARQVAMMATRWSESPLESLAMLWFRRQGLPLPQQQLTVRTDGGLWLARVDFVWPEFRTVCEVDGRQKYTDLDAQRPTLQQGKALWREKLREDSVRDTGLQVARGYWSDRDDDGAELAARIRRAFARAAASPFGGTYRIVDERGHARGGPLAA